MFDIEQLEIGMFLTIKVNLCKTELFEIKLFICMKMELALNNLQRLICHKTQINKFLFLKFNLEKILNPCTVNEEEKDSIWGVVIWAQVQLIHPFFWYLYTYWSVCVIKWSKVSDHSRGWPESSLFDSYYTKV